MGPHELHDQFSLAAHVEIAERIRQNPTLLETPRRRLADWARARALHPRYLDAWNELLAGPLEKLIEVLGDPGEWPTALRHTSPFAGILDVRTRNRIWHAVKERLESDVSRAPATPMTRAQLEHVIRAAATITADSEIVVIGSTSILGQFPNAPDEMLRSREADVYPMNHPDRFELLHVIGELSPFHETFGYYADPVQADRPRFPSGWKDRLIHLPVDAVDGRVEGLCPEVHDLVLSKYSAFRDKDLGFARHRPPHDRSYDAARSTRRDESGAAFSRAVAAED
jgi:uncharacterized nucleotidyltransferase DUF6036